VRLVSADPGAEETPPAADLLWKRGIGLPVSLSISPDGRYMAVVSKSGTVHCFGDSGRLVWKVVLPGVNRVVVGTDASAATYSFLNPLDSAVRFIAPDGELRWEHEVEGAV
jgi:hypothetical protein